MTGMPRYDDLFEHVATFDAEVGVATFAQDVPAAWAVYLMTDADDRPLQLLCVKNLRASLKRRLDPEVGSARTADLSAITKHVRYTRVDSAFEQDLRYLEAARACFPESYGGVLGFTPAWFVHFNPATKFPRLTKQNQIDKRTGTYVGPIGDKHAADKYVRSIEELFDLCRDRDRLLSDKSDPCQWREMGKCVGPCEGPPSGVSLDAYRALCGEAAALMADVPRAVAEVDQRMRQSAAATKFEVAAELKKRGEQLRSLRQKHYRHTRRVEDMRFLAVQPGGNGAAKLFAIRAGEVHFVAAVFANEPLSEAVLTLATSMLSEPAERPMSTEAFERVSLVSSHLYAAKKLPGTFLHVDELNHRTLEKAIQAAAGEVDVVDEADDGEVRGLQSFD
ncbi:MAG: hypothetical protein AAGI46_12790 [Planctomycetota bacterium]